MLFDKTEYKNYLATALIQKAPHQAGFFVNSIFTDGEKIFLKKI